MRVYTEINYEWDGHKLVEVSSECHDHHGDIIECKGVSSAPPPAPAPRPAEMSFVPFVSPTNPYVRQGGIGDLPAGQEVASGLPPASSRGLPQPPGMIRPPIPMPGVQGGFMQQGPQDPSQMMQPGQRSAPVMGRV